ncbi:MAG: alpha/beta fold hydrolase, partial [Chloroflexota bacterium]
IFLSFLFVACAPEGEFDDEYFDPIDDETDELYFEPEEDEIEAEFGAASDSDQALESRALATGDEDPPEVVNNSSELRAVDCPFEDEEGYGITCSLLIVPENRSDPDTAEIELMVAILPAVNEDTNRSPVIYLEGGPGGSAVLGFQNDVVGWAQYGFTQDRDLIFIDQRGTGYSTPSLNCIETDDDSLSSVEAASACHTRLDREEIDLAAYNTTENAADIAALADALNIDQYGLYGVSYGTRLALAVMRNHPEGIESVVLDSPFPPHISPAESEASLSYDRMQALFQACAQDEGCDGRFPNLEDVFLSTVEEMNANAFGPEDLSGDYLVDILYQSLFSADQTIHLLPLMIYEASEGRFELLEEVGEMVLDAGPQALNLMIRPAQDGEGNDGDSEGMYHSVMCRDEFSFANFTVAETNMLNSVPAEVEGGLFLTTVDQFNICDIWNVGQAAESVNEPVISDIPTLILVGEFDPATPPEWGEETAEHLSNSWLYELPGMGHSVTSVNNCA